VASTSGSIGRRDLFLWGPGDVAVEKAKVVLMKSDPIEALITTQNFCTAFEKSLRGLSLLCTNV
jgi:hypothetical protein